MATKADVDKATRGLFFLVSLLERNGMLANEAAAQVRQHVSTLKEDNENMRGALALVMPMAQEYAQGGGSSGPEMRDFREAQRLAGLDTE